MNWDYKHSLSIQIERQRSNISCGPRRWKWFIVKDVAAFFHYFKGLLISLVFEMTNSHVQQEQLHGDWGLRMSVKERLPWALAASGVPNPEFYSWRAPRHLQSGGSARATMVFDVQYASWPTHRAYNPSFLQSVPLQSSSLTIHIQSPAIPISLASSLTPAGMSNNP